MTWPALLLCVSMLVPTAVALAETPAQEVAKVATRFVAQSLTYDPTTAELTGLSFPDHSRFPDRTPGAIRAFTAEEAADLRALHAIPQTGFQTGFQAGFQMGPGPRTRRSRNSSKPISRCASAAWNSGM